jgi:hypothetical protein
MSGSCASQVDSSIERSFPVKMFLLRSLNLSQKPELNREQRTQFWTKDWTELTRLIRSSKTKIRYFDQSFHILPTRSLDVVASKDPKKVSGVPPNDEETSQKVESSLKRVRSNPKKGFLKRFRWGKGKLTKITPDTLTCFQVAVKPSQVFLKMHRIH